MDVMSISLRKGCLLKEVSLRGLEPVGSVQSL